MDLSVKPSHEIKTREEQEEDIVEVNKGEKNKKDVALPSPKAPSNGDIFDAPVKKTLTRMKKQRDTLAKTRQRLTLKEKRLELKKQKAELKAQKEQVEKNKPKPKPKPTINFINPIETHAFSHLNNPFNF